MITLQIALLMSTAADYSNLCVRGERTDHVLMKRKQIRD